MDGPRNRQLAATICCEVIHEDEHGKIIFLESENAIALIGKRSGQIHFFAKLDPVTVAMGVVTEVRVWRDQKAGQALPNASATTHMFVSAS